MKLRPEHALGAVALLVAAVIAYAATRTVGPVPMPAFTEVRSTGPLQEHLITAEELADSPVYVPHMYPGQVAHGIGQVVAYGFAPLYCIPDPQITALPSEQAW